MMDKENSKKNLKLIIDDKMKHVIAKYRVAQQIPTNIILATGKHYHVMLDFPATWREMKKNHYYRDYIWIAIKKKLSPDSYKDFSDLRLKGGESLFIRNSQIIGMTVNEETVITNISDFVSELVEVAKEYNLSDNEIGNYLDFVNEL